MNSVTLKRKERIATARKEKRNERNKQITLATVSGLVSFLVLMNSNAGASGIEYTVKKNDTLYSLSKRYGVNVDQIIEANNLTSEKIVVGQQLFVPNQEIGSVEEDVNTYTIQQGDTLSFLAKKFGTTVNELKKENHLDSDFIKAGQQIFVSGENLIQNRRESYHVVLGDTLWGIADRFGVSVKELMKENGLSKEMVLIGQRLLIPGESDFAEAEVVGAADNFTVEFTQQGGALVLKVPYGVALDYQKKAGQKVHLIHKNGAVISAS